MSPGSNSPATRARASGFSTQPLDRPLERPRPVGGIRALADDAGARAAGVSSSVEVLLGAAGAARSASSRSTIAPRSASVSGVEDDDLVDPVEELRPELRAAAPRSPRASSPRRRRRRRAPLAAAIGCAADVAGHDHDRVLEVDRPALAVGQPAVVEDLEQDVEDVRVGLLDLVEQDDLVRPAADRLGQLAALVVADVAGRRADEAATTANFSMYSLMSMRTIAVLVVEQELGEGAGQLGLADAGRAEEQERADRPARVA